MINHLTDGERDIWNEMQADAAPTWQEIYEDCRRRGLCPHCQNGIVCRAWDFDHDAPITKRCATCNGTGRICWACERPGHVITRCPQIAALRDAHDEPGPDQRLADQTDRADAAYDTIAALRAENERLRAALREIAEMTLLSHTAQDNVMQDIARAALEASHAE